MKDYPLLRKAITEIVYDNGAIFRGQPESYVVPRVYKAVYCYFNAEQLDLLENFMAGLSADQFETLCIGEEVDSQSMYPDPSTREICEEILMYLFEEL